MRFILLLLCICTLSAEAKQDKFVTLLQPPQGVQGVWISSDFKMGDKDITDGELTELMRVTATTVKLISETIQIDTVLEQRDPDTDRLIGYRIVLPTSQVAVVPTSNRSVYFVGIMSPSGELLGKGTVYIRR